MQRPQQSESAMALLCTLLGSVANHLPAIMASTAPPDYVQQPLVAIKGLFDVAVAAGGAAGPDPESDWGVPALFRKHLSSEEAISKVCLPRFLVVPCFAVP